MANGYRVTINSIVSDGTNYYVEASICSGANTFPVIRPVFPVGTAGTAITAYMQVVANNGPTLAKDIADLVNTSVTA